MGPTLSEESGPGRASQRGRQALAVGPSLHGGVRRPQRVQVRFPRPPHGGSSQAPGSRAGDQDRWQEASCGAPAGVTGFLPVSVFPAVSGAGFPGPKLLRVKRNPLSAKPGPASASRCPCLPLAPSAEPLPLRFLPSRPWELPRAHLPHLCVTEETWEAEWTCPES